MKYGSNIPDKYKHIFADVFFEIRPDPKDIFLGTYQPETVAKGNHDRYK
ncbi:MAG: hypothetical protein MRJ93_13230 [Nitrososphaeraceae archaeon]|nr:hypothetical protein [Nitrososphaeraceae archaeon]